jgi:Protein of unknown function (DUF3224)
MVATMSTHATATAEVASWDEKNYDETDGQPALAHAKIGNRYHGDLEAEGSARSLMIYRSTDSAEFTGLERVTGRLGERSGSFVVRTGGVYEDGMVTYDWAIVPGSGTGELRGLRGAGTVTWAQGESGSLAFDYDLD